jgi:hypothetical protein
MLDVMQFEGFWDYLEYSRIKQSSKIKKIRKLTRK